MDDDPNGKISRLGTGLSPDNQEVMEVFGTFMSEVNNRPWKRTNVLRALYAIIGDSFAPVHDDAALMAKMLGEMNAVVTARAASAIVRRRAQAHADIKRKAEAEEPL